MYKLTFLLADFIKKMDANAVLMALMAKDTKIGTLEAEIAQLKAAQAASAATPLPSAESPELAALRVENEGLRAENVRKDKVITELRAQIEEIVARKDAENTELRANLTTLLAESSNLKLETEAMKQRISTAPAASAVKAASDEAWSAWSARVKADLSRPRTASMPIAAVASAPMPTAAVASAATPESYAGKAASAAAVATDSPVLNTSLVRQTPSAAPKVKLSETILGKALADDEDAVHALIRLAKFADNKGDKADAYLRREKRSASSHLVRRVELKTLLKPFFEGGKRLFEGNILTRSGKGSLKAMLESNDPEIERHRDCLNWCLKNEQDIFM